MSCKYIYKGKEYSEENILTYISNNHNNLKMSMGLQDGWNVYINSERLSGELLLHEFQHLYNQWLKTNKPEIYQKGIELVKEELQKENSEIQSTIDYVRNTQPTLEGEALYEEILAQLIGERGQELLNSKSNSQIKQWLQDVWDAIKNMLGLSQMTIEQVRNLTIREFADASVTDILSGDAISLSKNQEIPSQTYESLTQQPFITKEQALEIYKEVYSDKLNGWQDIQELEC